MPAEGYIARLRHGVSRIADWEVEGDFKKLIIGKGFVAGLIVALRESWGGLGYEHGSWRLARLSL